MNKETYYRTGCQMIALVRCAVNGQQPKTEFLERIDLDALFEVCQQHILTACTAYALESAGIRDRRFTDAKNKAIRKNILLDAERSRILDEMEKQGIWYMPLKGALLKDWYPKLGMRQMSDNDILFDAACAEQVRDIMKAEGFETVEFGTAHRDVYQKPPVLNFEMHRRLFLSSSGQEQLGAYYKNVSERLHADGSSSFGRRFSDEDFYLYFLAHEYKHYSGGGTGVRSLADTYILLRKFAGGLDWAYLNRELEQLGLTDFERMNRQLAMHIFSGKAPLSPDERKELHYYICSGTYGTVSNKVENQLQGNASGSKLKYLLHRLFPPMEWIKDYYPFFYRHKILFPLFWIVRPLHGLFRNRKQLAAELHYLRKH